MESAFLNRHLKEVVHIVEWKWFDFSHLEGKFYKLKKALYKIKHATSTLHVRIDSFYKIPSFSRYFFNNLYVLRKDGKYLIVILYMNGLIIISDREELIQQSWVRLRYELKMKDLVVFFFYLRFTKCLILSSSHTTITI